ncbi:MAG: glutamine--fructose-6-phosphate transaminase (isomerizing) [Candidatus Nezhaarchaeales archaeon]
MCRIIGCVLSSGEAAPLLRSALKRLEYGGYDSVGIATLYGGRLYVKKDAGKIDEVHARLNLDDMPGSVGIGHTRWATHGAPTRVNAHPHTDCHGIVAVVHNGIIDNFSQVKQELVDRGHRFLSRTDTEVIAHLVEEGLEGGLSLKEAVLKAVKRLEGSYAIAVASVKEPDKLVCVRKESPLLLGLGEGANYCASDPVAFIPYTRRVVALENGDLAVLTSSSYEVFRVQDGVPVKRKLVTITWSLEQAEKHGFPHFMLKEIYEQPRSLRYALSLQEVYLDLIAEFLDRGKEVFLVAAGTSYHACLAASYMLAKLAKLSTHPVIASEFVEWYGPSINIDSVILAVSQSGETADVLNAIDYARFRAATILGVTNVVGSTLTRVSRAYIVQQSGPEIGVAATKTYTAQLAVLAQLALKLARKRGKVSQDEIDELKDELKKIPGLVGDVLARHGDTMKTLAKKYVNTRSIYFLGRGLSYATALEGRLKLLEVAYIPAIAYPAGESKHGPISLIEKGFPVVFVAPPDETRKSSIGNMMELKARGAKIIALADENDEEVKGLADDFIGMPSVSPILSPIVYIVPLQLFAYYTAVEKGLDPDKPRNLAKSVTVP